MKGICHEFDSSEKDKRCPHSGEGTSFTVQTQTESLTFWMLNVHVSLAPLGHKLCATTVTMSQPIVVMLVLVHTPSHT